MDYSPDACFTSPFTAGQILLLQGAIATGYPSWITDFVSGIPPSAPGAPTISGTAGLTNASMTWTPSTTEGVPAETYTLFCMANTATSCNYANKVGSNVAVDVARTTTSGTVTGLVANTPYKCCVMARNNVATVYSTSSSVTTSG